MPVATDPRGALAALTEQYRARHSDLENLRNRALESGGTVTEAELNAAVAARDSLNPAIDALRAQIEPSRAGNGSPSGLTDLALGQGLGEGQIGGHGASPQPGTWVRDVDGLPAAVDGRWSDHPIVSREHARRAAAEQAITGMHSGIGSQVRAMSTTSGSAVVPTVWADDIIDRARNASRVLQAGAQIVPMDAKIVQIGRLTTDPTAAFRAEGSTVTASDPVFDNVTLTATTMSALVVGSMEWFMDAANVDEVVGEAIAKAIALQLDLVSLYGSITSGAGTINLPTPNNPRGVLGNLLANAAGNVFAAATNGTALTQYDQILDLLFTVRDGNFDPNALIWNTKLGRALAKLKDTTNQPLQLPPDVAGIDRLTSNQIPSYTQGTATGTATDAFAGQWDQLIIGQRLGLTIQTLTERYAELGQVGIIAHWRGDVQCAQPRAFAVYRALIGA